MKKEKLERDFNVNLNKVKFVKSKNGLYSTSEKEVKGFYILEENGNYQVILDNSVYGWRVDLHELEEIKKK